MSRINETQAHTHTHTQQVSKQVESITQPASLPGHIRTQQMEHVLAQTKYTHTHGPSNPLDYYYFSFMHAQMRQRQILFLFHFFSYGRHFPFVYCVVHRRVSFTYKFILVFFW